MKTDVISGSLLLMGMSVLIGGGKKQGEKQEDKQKYVRAKMGRGMVEGVKYGSP